MNDFFLNFKKKISSEHFLSTINQVTSIIANERKGNYDLENNERLVIIPNSAKIIVVGDLHGDLNSFKHILLKTKFIERTSDKKTYIIFLGDYGDRGKYSSEVYYNILCLKILFPDRVILLQGNHEGPLNLPVYPHDLPMELKKKFGEHWSLLYKELCKLYRNFNISALIKGKCIMLHGGIPSQTKDIKDVAYAFQKHPTESHLEEILWSDPKEEILGIYPSNRGAGRYFGKNVTKSFLKNINVNILIRSHEPFDEGYKFHHDDRVLTLFSSKSYPYNNKYGSYLDWDSSTISNSAIKIESSIRIF
jgi:protein phosphatase